MKPISTIIAVVVVALAGSGLMQAQGGVLSEKTMATASPFVGTWKLNLAKSKFTGTPPKSETRTIEDAGNGYKYTFEGIVADGSPIAFSFTTNLDGKAVPFSGSGTPGGADMIAVKRIDSNTLTSTSTKAGKVVRTGRAVVSKDGKVMTNTAKGTDANGQPITQVLVWDKQ